MTYGIAFGKAIILERQAEREARTKNREAHFAKCARKIFVKVSGDLFLSSTFHEWVTTLAQQNHVVISIGGGTQINDEFARRGIAFKKHDRLGRETTSDGYRVAAKVLQKNREQLEKVLETKSAIVEVMLPIITMHGVKCHIDGDLMVMNAYWGFDDLFVVTTPDRVETKERLFVGMQKVRVVGMT